MLCADTALPSTGTLALLGVVVLVQLALLAAALVDLLRRPDEAVTGGRRWVWIIVVVLLQTIGPIVYFAAGRRPRPVDDPAGAGPATGGAPAEGPAARVADLLYGPAGDATSGPSSGDGEDGPPQGGARPPERIDGA
ncbi:MAG: PLDc_N domain-containing protein [Thermoleophilia bacterium]|nr:PLDc_N domain-containing protein [Thermoleophilia bacterium]